MYTASQSRHDILINKARLFFVQNFVFGLTKNIRQDTNRLHIHPHTNLLQNNTLNRLGEILHMGNHSHDFRLLGFAFRVSRPSFAMKSWISISNQDVIDRTYFIFFGLVLFNYVLSSGEKSSGNAKFLLKWMVEEKVGICR